MSRRCACISFDCAVFPNRDTNLKQTCHVSRLGFGATLRRSGFSSISYHEEMMLKQLTQRLRDRTVITAAILSLMGCDAYAADNSLGGSHAGDRKADTRIKHVIVIMGENRTFDHVFATYVPHYGARVDNLLSKG